MKASLHSFALLLLTLSPSAASQGSPTLGMTTRTTVIRVTNNTGQAASCLDLNLATGGALSLPPLQVLAAPDCPTPSITITNTAVNINWGQLCIPDQGTVTLIVQSTRANALTGSGGVATFLDSLRVSFVSGSWTRLGGVITGAANPGDVVIIDGGVNSGGGGGGIVISIKYIPISPLVCGPLMAPVPPTKCWTKLCCVAVSDCFLTLKINGNTILNCAPTGLRRPAFKVLVRVTNPPPHDS